MNHERTERLYFNERYPDQVPLLPSRVLYGNVRSASMQVLREGKPLAVDSWTSTLSVKIAATHHLFSCVTMPASVPGNRAPPADYERLACAAGIQLHEVLPDNLSLLSYIIGNVYSRDSGHADRRAKVPWRIRPPLLGRYEVAADLRLPVRLSARSAAARLDRLIHFYVPCLPLRVTLTYTPGSPPPEEARRLLAQRRFQTADVILLSGDDFSEEFNEKTAKGEEIDSFIDDLDDY